MFIDLPRGPIKNNSMKKLAAKTLMEILPEEIGKNVHAFVYIPKSNKLKPEERSNFPTEFEGVRPYSDPFCLLRRPLIIPIG